MTNASRTGVSVVMSVRNGQRHLREAVDSILGQTYRDFELIIVDDGSTDGTLEILRSYGDPRITLIPQEHRGLVPSLNRAIGSATAPYVARMDADDVAAPSRLEDQTAFLDSHPEFVLVGSNLLFIDESGHTVLDSPLLLHDEEIRLEMLTRCPFGHSSVMFRREAAVAAGLYRRDYWPAEDYDLWRRLATHGRFANLNTTLTRYRVSAEGVTSTNGPLQAEKTWRVQGDLWADDRFLPLPPSLASVVRSYPDSDARPIQVDRLAALYWRVARAAAKRRRIRFSMGVLGRAVGSPLGAALTLRSVWAYGRARRAPAPGPAAA